MFECVMMCKKQNGNDDSGSFIGLIKPDEGFECHIFKRKDA